MSESAQTASRVADPQGPVPVSSLTEPAGDVKLAVGERPEEAGLNRAPASNDTSKAAAGGTPSGARATCRWSIRHEALRPGPL